MFNGLEGSLQVLDLSGNKIAGLAEDVFHRLGALRDLNIEENSIEKFKPVEFFSGFQFSLNHLKIGGTKNPSLALQDLKKYALNFLSLH